MRIPEVVKITWEKKHGLLFCRQTYDTGESWLILVEGDPTEFIRKIGRLQDGISNQELSDAVAKAFPDYPEKEGETNGE